MSTFGWFAVVILPVLGGLIAWAGDVIGYRLGKSRRSLFGLRPRTTARLIGIVVGVALPLIGVGVALLGSSEARDALFHLDELRQRQAELTAQNQLLEAQRARTLKQAEASEQRARDLRADLYTTRHSLSETRFRVVAASRELGRAQQEVRRASGNAERLRAIAERLQRALTPLQKKAADLQRHLDDLQVQLQDKTAALVEKANELTTREAELHRKEADIETLKRNFLEAVELINSPVQLETGHELVRTPLEIGRTLEDTEDRLLKVLLTAGRVAEQWGAEPGPNGLAVRLLRPLPPDFAADQGLPREADIVHAYARQLHAGGAGTFVIGVRVARRMYEAEQAPVGVELWPPRPRSVPYVRVFFEDQVIYQTEIDGSDGREAVFTQLYNLVTKIVRREAKESGLLPNPETGEYGTVNFGQLFEAMDAVAAHKGPVLVQVVAAADTYITDPLLIRIEVGKGAKATGDKDRSGG
ncbi:MAG: DUF3084 domain-containing protein [Armatimonadetes bacterium]|nr:DUF3084 domain-containing protein [Armatimonadota bacterium]